MHAKGPVPGPRTRTSAPTASQQRAAIACPKDGQPEEDERLAADGPHNGAGQSSWGHPPATPRNIGLHERTLWGSCKVPTPAPAAKTGHGTRLPAPRSTDPTSHARPNPAPHPAASHITSARVRTTKRANLASADPTPRQDGSEKAPPHTTAQQYTAQHEATRHTAPQPTAVQRTKTRHPTTRHTTTRHGATRHRTAHHSTTRRDTARQSRAHHNTAQTSTVQHSKTGHNTARRTKAHHNTKARDANRGSNPSKPPHTPEGEETRPQPWDDATPARRTPATGHRTPGNDSSRPPTQTASRKLKPAPQRRRDTKNPTPPKPGPYETAWHNRPAGRART